MRRIKLTFQYNGTPFFGFQRIDQGPSVQASIEKAIFQITKEKVDLKVAGRTDKGVHANGQVAHFDLEHAETPLIKFLDGITHYTRPHIAMTKVEEVTEDFHARHTATARSYEYLLQHGQRHQQPTLFNRTGHVKEILNITAMQEAIRLFPMGEIDCSSFRSAECQSSTPMVRMHSMEMTAISEDLLSFKVTANHFLHNMIRILIGSLIEVGLEKETPDFLKNALEAKNRTKAGPTFAPDGLYLNYIEYPEHEIKAACPKA